MKRLSSILAAMLVVALTAQTGVAVAGYNFVDGVSAADTSTLWIWGSNAVDGTFISRSTDGGVTWQARAWEPQLAVNAVDARPDGQSAVAVIAGEDNVITTTDGGSTWTTSAPMFGSAQVSLNDIEWLPGSPGTRLAVGQLRDTEHGTVALFGRAPAGTWATAFEGPWYSPATEFDPIPQTWAEGWAIDAAPDGTTYAIANEYDFVAGEFPTFMRPLVYKSTDSGSTWTTAVASAVSSGYPVTSIAAVSSNVAFAGDDAARHVLRTLDGVNWAPFQLPITSPTPSSLALDALDANKLLVGGYNGRLGWTSNASSPTPAFTYFTVPGSPKINSVAMLSATNWIAVGANETIYRTTNAGGTWTGSTVAAAPGVTMTAPAPNFSLNSGAVAIQGTSADAGVGVARVEVRIRRADGQTWNGVAWSAADTWLPAQRTSGSWNAWTHSWTPDAALLASGQSVSISARATDGMALSKSTLGVYSQGPTLTTNVTPGPVAYGSSVSIAGTMNVDQAPVAGRMVTIEAIDAATGAVTTLGSVTTGASGTYSRTATVTKNTAFRAVFGGDVEFGASSSTPASVAVHASLPVPTVSVAWVRPRLGAPLVRRATVTGSLLPAHTAGSTAVRLYFERYVVKNGVGRWVPVTSKLVRLGSNGTSYSCTQWLTAGGTWRVRAKHADASHASTASGTRSFSAR